MHIFLNFELGVFKTNQSNKKLIVKPTQIKNRKNLYLN